MNKTFPALLLATALTSYASQAKASYAYDNLPYIETYETGQRFFYSGMAIAQSFQLSTSGDIKSVVFGLGNFNAVTGSVEARLYHANNFGLYNQVGSTATFSINSINLNGYTSLNVSNLGWSFTSGTTYAVALTGAADFYNPDVGAGIGGVWWKAGNSSSDNRNVFLSWYLPEGNWENVSQYAPAGRGLSLGLVPEPSTYGLMGLGALAVAMVVRRKKKAA